VTAYEEAVPALDNFIAAVQSGDAIQIAQSVRNDLPKIQRLLGEIEAVRQQLQQAGAQ
jgi:capsule polysaccharide export protein KpsE/RkpR